MARLTALPSLDIIHGFQGILDFYLWKGLPCARKWPYTPPSHVTEGTLAARAIFGAISQGYSLLGEGALQAFQDDAADQPRTARDIYMTAVYGHLHERTIPEPPPPPEEQMYDAYVCLRDKKPQGTNGGTFTQGAWRTRDLTEEQADTDDICGLVANQFTLPAGTYRCLISCPAYRISRHQATLYNVTLADVILWGSCCYTSSALATQTHALITGRFTLAAPTTLEIQHRSQATRADQGFGVNCGWGEEIYTVAEFFREAPPE